MSRVPASFLIPVLFLLVSPVWANFSGLSSVGFSNCYVEAKNTDGATCSDSEFVLGGSCAANCFVPAADAEISGQPPWEIYGVSNSFHGDSVHSSLIYLQAVRSEPEFVTVSGFCSPDLSGAEVALFRFGGDPSVFDGTAAMSVTEFVALGWIDATDVLFVYDCSGSTQIDVDVDVDGIPDEELVIFGFAPTSAGTVDGPPVPALSTTAAVVLVILLLGAGVLVLRSRA